MDKEKKLKLLLESAPIMSQFASKYCKESNIGDKYMQSREHHSDCEWYHAAWQYCKLTEISPILNYHKNQFKKFFYETINQEKINVLISGAADYAILEDVLETIPKNIINKVHITVLDLCRTPLEICKWYIDVHKKMGATMPNISFKVGDALHTDFRDNSFDLITTYFFVSRFRSEERMILTKEWSRLLKSKGKIIITELISSFDDEINSNRENKLLYFLKKASHNIDGLKVSSEYKNEVMSKLEIYGKNIINQPIISENYFVNLFENFSMIEMVCGEIPGELEETMRTMTITFKNKA